MKNAMKIETKAVHAGDRKKDPAARRLCSRRPRRSTPRPPISTRDTAKLDRVFGPRRAGFCYARYDNPTTRRWKNW